MKAVYIDSPPATHKYQLIKNKNANPIEWDRFQILELIKEMDIAESTATGYRYGINMFLNWLDDTLGSKHPVQITRADFIRYKNWMKNRNKYTIPTKNLYIVAVQRMYVVLERYGVTNPAKGTALFKYARTYKKEGITVNQWRDVLKTIPTRLFNSKKHHLIMFLLFSTGVRQMSLRELKWKDFCYKVGVGLEMIVRLKGTGIRIGNIPLNDEACTLLENFRFAYRKHYCNMIANEYAEINQEWYVFGNKDRMLTERAMRKLTTNYLKLAGVHKDGKITTHSLRHGFAQHIVNKHGINTAQILLCHGDINSTRIYAGQAEKVKIMKEVKGTLNNITKICIVAEEVEEQLEEIKENALDFAFSLNDF